MKKFLTGLLLLVLAMGCVMAEAAAPGREQEALAAEQVQSADAGASLNLAEQYKMDADFILIKKREFKLYAVDGQGNILAAYGCALGKNAGQKEREGDMKTPDGVFAIDEILDASSWTHDFGDGKGEIEGAYGPWFISLDTTNLSGGRWGGIGIHGTHAPESIGTRASEGCIRLKNSDIVQLEQFAHVGMKVVIEE